MDPKVVLERFFHAQCMGDKTEAREAYADLAEWLENGGAAPSVSGGQLQNCMAAMLRDMTN